MLLKKLSMNWKKWLKLLSFLVFLTIVFLWLKSDFWQVKKINCRLDNQDCPADLFNKAAEISLRKNLIFFPQAKVAKEIQAFYPQTSPVKIKKIIFNTLIFELSSRKNILALGIELPFTDTASDSAENKEQEFVLENNFYLLDKEGIVLEKTEKQPDLPLLVVGENPNLKIGDNFIDSEIKKVIEILYGLKTNLIEAAIFRLRPNQGIEVLLKNKVQVFFTGQKEIGLQLDSLQLIFNRAKIEGKEIKKIDLRFDKPVIN